MQLIALEEFHYDGKTRKRGDEFDAPKFHAQLLIQGGRAKEKETKKVQIETAAMTAENAEAIVPVKRGRYQRRDMRPTE